jgi:hypothetical protein
MIEDKANDVNWIINYIKVNWNIMMQIPEIIIGLPILSWLAAKYYYKGNLAKKDDLIRTGEKKQKLLEEENATLKAKLKSENKLSTNLLSENLNLINSDRNYGNFDAFGILDDKQKSQESPLRIEFKEIFFRKNPNNIESYQTYWCEIYNSSDESVKNVSVSLIHNEEHPLKYQRYGNKPNIILPSGQKERVDLISCGKINTGSKHQIIIEGDREKIWIDADLNYSFKVKVTAKGCPELIKEFGFSIKGGKQPPEFKVYLK